MGKNIPIAIAYGDGIGPEIMEATLSILEEANAPIETHPIEMGETIYKEGNASGITDGAWEKIRETDALLKAPVASPPGGNYKNLNLTLRTTLGLYANVRHAIAYHPFIATKHPNTNVVIIRENEEDLYTGIEYHQTAHVYTSTKLISRDASQRIIRYAFEYAKTYGKKKVSCLTKNTMLKISDGFFATTFDEIAAQYPEILHEQLSIDVGAGRLAKHPELFDVIVTPNLYGDILSSIAFDICGSSTLGSSANIGEEDALFETTHGSATALAGKNSANPSGMITAAISMLVYLQQPDVASLIHNAWLKTIEEGIHTGDIYQAGNSRELVGTKEFSRAVIQRLGHEPSFLSPVRYIDRPLCTEESLKPSIEARKERTLVGIDLYLHSDTLPEILVKDLLALPLERFTLRSISNRGVLVYPIKGCLKRSHERGLIDQWQCRFFPNNGNKECKPQEVLSLMELLHHHNFEIIRSEYLYTFDGWPGYSSQESHGQNPH